jgi:6-phosphogluconolactonase (cycloisomerase 2 family)
LRRVLLAALLLSACTTKRTEIVIGVATNLDAPTPLSSVHATVSREGVPLLQQDWTLPGVPQGQFELPGSLGVYTDDGTEPRIEIELVAFDTTGSDIIHRRSILSLVKEQTLFLRMTLTDSCIHRSDCTDSQTCIEGHCVPVDIDAHILPPYVDKMEFSVSCQTGIHYKDTGTKMDMPMLGPGCGAGETCSEGTCLKMPSVGGDGGTPDGGGPMPDGGGGPVRFAYVSNAANNEIRNFTVDPMGTLTTLTAAVTVPAPGTPAQLMVDPSNNFLVVTVSSLAEVASYAINQSTGVPSLIGTAGAGTTPVSLAIHPAGFVYVANQGSNNVSLLTLNSTTGALTFVSNQTIVGTGVAWVAMDPMGKNLYVTATASTNLTVFSINSQTGALIQMGAPLTTGTSPVQVLVDPAGAFVHTANSGGGSVSHFTRDPSTGGLTPLTGMDAASGMTPRSLVITPDGRFAFVGNSTGGNITIFQITGSTWTATGAPFTINGQPQFVTLNPAGNVLYAVNTAPGTILPMQINTSTGALSALQGIATGTTPVSITFAR